MTSSLKTPPETALTAHKEAWSNGKGRFLIDGFPRKMDQAVKFDESVSIPFLWFVEDSAGLEMGSTACVPCFDELCSLWPW